MSLTTILLRNDGKRRSLSVKPVTKDGDAVFLNAETRDAIFGKGVRPEAVIVKGNGKKLRAEFRTRRGDVLANDCIEVTSSVLDGLFPEDRRFDEAWPQQRDISIRAYGTHGFEGYWLAADKRQRFQNQFAVYLGVLLLAVQLVIDFGLK